MTWSAAEVSFKHCNTVFMCPWIQESKTNASDVDRKRLPKLRRDSDGDERRYGSSEPSSAEVSHSSPLHLHVGSSQRRWRTRSASRCGKTRWMTSRYLTRGSNVPVA